MVWLLDVASLLGVALVEIVLEDSSTVMLLWRAAAETDTLLSKDKTKAIEKTETISKNNEKSERLDITCLFLLHQTNNSLCLFMYDLFVSKEIVTRLW